MSETKDTITEADMAEKIVNELHKIAGVCGHCMRGKCAGREQHSKLPATLPTDKVLLAIERGLGVKL